MHFRAPRNIVVGLVPYRVYDHPDVPPVIPRRQVLGVLIGESYHRFSIYTLLHPAQVLSLLVPAVQAKDQPFVPVLLEPAYINPQ